MWVSMLTKVLNLNLLTLAPEMTYTPPVYDFGGLEILDKHV